MKRVLSFLMAVLLIVSLLPTHALHAHAEETYTLVTSIDQLSTGSTVVIAATDKSVALSTTQNPNNRGQATITKSDDTITITDTVQKLTLEAGTTTGTYAFNTGSGYLYAASSSKNYLRTETTLSANSSWKISVTTEGVATITAQGSNTRNVMQYNTSGLFACYSSASQAGVALYVLSTGSSCSHTNTTTTTVDATCTATGSTTVKCDDCGETVSTETIDALGHNYVLNGTTYTCSRCGDTYETFYVSFSVPAGVTAVDPIVYRGNGVALPTAGAPEGYTFVGWVKEKVENASTAPEFHAAGDTFTATKAVTLIALYSYSEGGSGSTSTDYVLTDIANIGATDEVVIVMTKGGTYYPLSSANGSSDGPAKPTITSDGNKLTATPAAELLWNVSGNASGYTFTVKDGTAKLYTINDNDGVRVGTNSNNVFTIVSNTNGTYLKNTATGRYVGVYTGGSDWRCYTSINSNITGQTLQFYVKAAGAALSYTTEITSTECEHTNTTTATVAATCTEAGSTTITCDDCHEVISTTVLDKLDHTVVTDAAVAATCTETGLTEGSHCSVCNEEIVAQTETAALGHNYVNGTCSRCGAAQPAGFEGTYYIATIRSSGNYWYMTSDLGTASTKRYQAEDSGLTKVPEKITEPEDNKTFVIVNNGDGTYSVYAKGVEGNNYLGWDSGNSGALVAQSSALKLNITQQDDGTFLVYHEVSERYLSLNNNAGSDYFAWYSSVQAQNLSLIPVETCEHTYGEGVVTPPTCTTAGYTTYTCTKGCGNSYTADTVAALGHSYNDGEVTKAATCTIDGVKTYTCTVCGATKTEAIPASHTLSDDAVIVEATCETPGSKTYSCTACDESVSEAIPALGHEWGEGVETTSATCETAGVMTYNCSRGCTKTKAIAATGHSYVNGTCENCGKEISSFQLVTDYTKILAGGEYIIAAKVGNAFYAIDSGLKAQEVTVTGTGANIMVEYEEGLPVWNLEYFQNRNDCFSIYNPEIEKYLTGTDSASLTTGDTAWAWTFIDGSTKDGEETEGDSGYGTLGVLQSDGSVAFVAASATVTDRAISLLNTEEFKNYSVRTSGYNRELYFFKMVEANETEYTVTYVENGISYSKTVPVNENVEILPNALQNLSMPNGYTNFAGWVKLPYAESLVAPAKVYALGEDVQITEDTTFYALYTREDSSAEGQALSYHRVTDNNQLVQGQMYIIVGYDENTQTYYAMSKNQLSGDRGAAVVEPDENGVITFTPADNVATLQLTQGYVLDSFAFLDVSMNKFLYCSSTATENGLNSEAEMSEKSSFFINIATGSMGYYSEIESQTQTSSRNNLAYNTISDDNGSFIFSCYNPSITTVKVEQTALYVGVPNSTSATYYTTGLCAHQWKEEVVKATCENAGYTIKTCTICGEVQVTDVQAHGHNPGTYTVTSEPTCTTTGTQTSICQNADCGKEFTETIPALGHNYVGVVTAPTCTAAGYTTYTCSRCSHSYTGDNVAATGHNLTTEAKQDGATAYLLRTCQNKCGYSEQVNLAFSGASLTLENTLIINYAVKASVFAEGNFEEPYVEFSYGNRVNDLRIVVDKYTVGKNASGEDVYIFSCYGITPSQIGDTVTAVLHAKYADTDYTHTNNTYSVSQYCYNMLRKENNTNANLKTLLVDLLYYCDAARAYTTYEVEKAKVTANLTEAEKAYATTSTPDLTSILNTKHEKVEDPKVTWKGASVVLYHSVAMRFRFAVENIESADDLSVKVTMGNEEWVIANDPAKNEILIREDPNNLGQYYVFFDQMKARDMRTAVYITVYEGEKAISNTVCYSVESYACAKQNDANVSLAELVKALMRYGDSAVKYFASK